MAGTSKAPQNGLIFGILIGLVFPIVATLLHIYSLTKPINIWTEIIELHSQNMFVWIIDTAPICLGITGYIIGIKQYSNWKILQTLQSSINKKTHDLQLRNRELQVEIEEKLIAEKQLIIAKEDAERGKRAEELFLANMSHELRTPLNGIVGFSRLLLSTELNAEQSDYTNTIQQSANHLMAIINDILEISKIKAGEIEFEEQPTSLTKLVMNAVNTFKVMAKQKNLAVYEELDRKIPPYILADQTRLLQILLNLINNAIKFTEEGRVVVSTKLLNETAERVTIKFSVEDSGIGISKESIGKIFGKFKQAEISTNRTHGGTGLGLAICKEMVELQGGKIYVDSQLGVGSTFSFDLTFKIALSKEIAEPNKGAIELKDLGSLNILLVEDNKINVKFAERVFKKWGNQLSYLVANNGAEALKLHAEHNFDVILMDLQMPIMDGFTATKKIRTEMDAPYNAVPIIALTADVMVSEKQKAFEAGINDYITKPFDANKLFTTIAQITQ